MNKIVNSDYGPFIINENDKYIGNSILNTGWWAKEDIQLIESIIKLLLTKKKQLIMYDIGANIGTHSIALSKIFKEQINIRSFEAQRQIYHILCGNIALNNLDNIYAHNVAVSDISNKLIEIAVPDYNQPNNFGGLELIPPNVSDNQDMIKNKTEMVSTIKIDDCTETVDFIKLDIEGMEHLALKGARKKIKVDRPICFVEMYKTDTKFVKNFFSKNNYVAYEYKNMDWIFFPEECPFGLLNTKKIILKLQK